MLDKSNDIVSVTASNSIALLRSNVCSESCVPLQILSLILPIEHLQNPQPNIVFLLADDLGWGDVNYNGGQADTPNLNAMAAGENSVQFSRFYSGAPVCSPTRGTVLTGRNHNRYCIWKANTHSKGCNWTNDFDCPAKLPLPPSEVTVAEVLQTAGYRTAAFGKWHLGDLKHLEHGHLRWSPSHPGMHGFDVWKVTERAVPTVNPNCACFDSETCRIGHYARSALPACTTYHGNNASAICSFPSSTVMGADSLVPYPSPSCPTVAHTDPILGDDSHFIVRELNNFVEESMANSQPFFAYVAFHTPHSRYIAPPEYADKYAKRGWKGKERDYYGAIEALDNAIGQILKHLDRMNATENTMIWFTSDNGPSANGPGSTHGLRGEKGTLYEGGIRVPGILQWPSVVTENKVSDYLVSTNDFLPTVLDLTGSELPDSRALDGTSILPFLLGSRTTRSITMNWAFRINGNFSGKFHAVSMEENLKLHILYKKGKVLRTALYNVTENEETNLSSVLPRETARMVRNLNSWTNGLVISATEEVGCMSDPGYFNP